MRQINTHGLVLKKYPFGEQDFFVTIYSPLLGRFDALAKGARKIDSKFTGHLETLNICNIQLYKSSSKYIITQCQISQSFRPIRDNLELSMLSLLLIEIFYNLAHAHENGNELFDLIEKSLTQLSKNNKNALAIETFKIKILKLSGALPDISNCSQCHHKWSATDTILIDPNGHIFCHMCGKPWKIQSAISFNIMKLINFIAIAPHEKIEQLKLQTQDLNQLKKITDSFLHTYINKEINCEKITRQIVYS